MFLVPAYVLCYNLAGGETICPPPNESEEPPVGIEPTTDRLRSDSSTLELRWRGPNYTKQVRK